MAYIYYPKHNTLAQTHPLSVGKSRTTESIRTRYVLPFRAVCVRLFDLVGDWDGEHVPYCGRNKHRVPLSGCVCVCACTWARGRNGKQFRIPTAEIIPSRPPRPFIWNYALSLSLSLSQYVCVCVSSTNTHAGTIAMRFSSATASGIAVNQSNCGAAWRSTVSWWATTTVRRPFWSPWSHRPSHDCRPR